MGNNYALGTVNHKGAAVGHQRKIAHEHFGFFDLAAFLIEKPGRHPKGGRVGGVSFLALFHRVVWLVYIQLVVYKVQNQVASVIRNPGNILKDFLQSFVQKPLVGILLYLDQVRHFQNLINAGKTHSHRFSQVHRFDVHHRLNHSFIYLPPCGGTNATLSSHQKFSHFPLHFCRNDDNIKWS